MYYWNNGWYMEQSPQGDRYEVDEELYRELDEGTAAGKVVKKGEDGRPYLAEPDPPSEEELKERRLEELLRWFREYDIEVIKSIRRNIDITNLHEQAEYYANEIKELRGDL